MMCGRVSGAERERLTRGVGTRGAPEASREGKSAQRLRSMAMQRKQTWGGGNDQTGEEEAMCFPVLAGKLQLGFV